MEKTSDKRKGLIRKVAIAVEIKKQLKLDRDIDDKSLWYVSVNDGISTTKRPCKLSSLNESYLKQNKGWDVTVIGCWVGMNGGEFIKF